MKNSMQSKILTICYGKVNVYNSRNEAKKFYLECMLSSDGSEHERYSTIYQDLEQGFNLCVDSEFYEDLEFGNLKFIDEENHTDLKKYILDNLDDNCNIKMGLNIDKLKEDILDSKFKIVNNSIDYIIKNRNLERKALLIEIINWMYENVNNISEINTILDTKDDLAIEHLEPKKINNMIIKGLAYISNNINKEDREKFFLEKLGMDFVLRKEYKIDYLVNETKIKNEEGEEL